MTADHAVELDHLCADHQARRCLICYPPVDVWVADGSDWGRVDADGTRWAVCPDRPSADGGDIWTLCMVYREHRLISEHSSREAAMRHRDDMARMLAARSLRGYAGGA